MYFLFVEIGK